MKAREALCTFMIQVISGHLFPYVYAVVTWFKLMPFTGRVIAFISQSRFSPKLLLKCSPKMIFKHTPTHTLLMITHLGDRYGAYYYVAPEGGNLTPEVLVNYNARQLCVRARGAKSFGRKFMSVATRARR